MRDDFKGPIKEKIAKRASYLCSNPHCRRLTIGAAEGHDGAVNIGVIAHITAASPGGPRYDGSLTPEQRGDADNGILLCQAHAHLVDVDEENFPVDLLRKWKRDIERFTSESVLGLGGPAQKGLPDPATFPRPSGGADLDAVSARVLAAAGQDLVSIKRMPGWPRHPVELNLHLTEGGSSRPFQISALAAAVETFNELTVIAPPGTGKTTTLIQTAGAIHGLGRVAPLVIPLGEWASQGRAFLSAVLTRPSLAGVNEADLQRLAESGRLALMLDGWNELDGEARKRATAELRALQRDYPRLCVVISTRRQALDVPIGGPKVEIDLLNDAQQVEIARAYRGDDGVGLVDAAWRVPGLRELVTIPLYLTALLESTPGAALPTTKEEVLRLFAGQHEGAADKADALREALFGFHPRMLTALATEATSTANTAISETRARTVVRAVEDRLTEEGQITVAPQPTIVLDVLVSRHTLVRSGSGALSFQHQQFQEWYASFEVEEAMRAAATGDAVAKQRLRVEFLDKRSWEEPILFACERLSRSGTEGAHAVAEAVLSALSIDPLLAAEMIFRSSEAVWQEIAERVIAFVRRWHKPGDMGRPVAFMISSGRLEFADVIWPLVESPDSQVYLSVMRAGRRFRPAVLGPDAAKRLAAIPDATRAHVLAELAHRSGVDGMMLAAYIAKADPSAEVQFEVVQALLFRRGDRHANELLKTAPDAVWVTLAKHGYSDEIADPAAAARVRAERAKLSAAATEPAEILRLMTDEAASPAVSKAIADAVSSVGFAIRNQHSGTALYRAHERHPEAVGQGILCRLEAKLEIPFRAYEYLTAIAPIDDGPIAALILDAGTPAAAAITAAHVAGPKVAQALMNEVAAAAAALAEAAQPDKQAASERLREWRDRLAATPEASFVTALASCDAAAEPPVIAAIADAVGRHGSRDQDKPPLNVGGEAARIDTLMKAWSAALVASPDSSRGQLWHLAIAIGRLARTELLGPLKQLRDEDARRHQEAREKVRAMGRQAAPTELRSDASTGYSLQYRDAFARMGAAAAPLMIDYLTDLEFGFDAACALKSIYDRTNGVEKPSVFKSWPHLADAAARRAAGPLQGDTTYADAVFAAVEVLTGATSTPEQQALAIMIARMALGMPCRDQANLIARLLALPRAVRHKRELVAALVMAGHSFDADLGLAAIAEWIEDAKQNTWRFRDSLWEVVGWLELLPFSNRPASVLGGIQMLVDVQPTRERMERAVLAAGEAPDLGEDRIAEMFRRFPWLASEHEWADAVFARGTVASGLTIINLVKQGRLGTARGGLDHWWLAQRLAPLARRTPAMKAEILKAYQDTVGPAHRMLERTLEELGGDDCVLALVHGYARAGKRFDGSLHQALQHTAVDQQRIGDSNTYNLHPVSIAPLRKKLFELMHGTDATVAALSQECLMNIDYIRDHMGAVETEPRHPDVATGKPWPPEADGAA